MSNYQIEKEQLLRQQEILASLGYYKGELDGIWGPKTIEAKKAYEKSLDFIPGIPNNGMPFSSAAPYPAGIYKTLTGGRGSVVMLECAARLPYIERLKNTVTVKADKSVSTESINNVGTS